MELAPPTIMAVPVEAPVAIAPSTIEPIDAAGCIAMDASDSTVARCGLPSVTSPLSNR